MLDFVSEGAAVDGIRKPLSFQQGLLPCGMAIPLAWPTDRPGSSRQGNFVYVINISYIASHFFI